MATLASAAGSSFVQQKRQISVETTTAASAASVGISTTPTTITDCTPLLTASDSSASSSSSSSCSSTSSSCESGVVLSGSSICSSITNSPTSTTSSFIANAAGVKTLTAAAASASTTLMTASIIPASLLAVSVTSTPPAETTMSLSSTSLSLPLLSSSFTPISSSYTPISSSATTTSLESVATSTEQHATAVSSNTSAHQLLLNGLSVSDADLNGTVNSSSLVEDTRALQLALELSMVGLNDSVHLQVQQQQLQLQQLQQQHLQHMQQQQQQLSQQHQQQQSQHQQQQSSFDMSALSAAVAAAAAAANNQAPNHSSTAIQLNQFSSALLPGIEDRSKKSQNMTECVPVPSSEHVAEIVGRQGCKIKALRAKTNTYIKTPVRGEEPVFVVTGRKEDVAKAKREILSAAEHFSVIRASRKPSLAGSLTGSLNGTGSNAKTPPGPPSIPGQVTIQVRVPYRVVGLVVGPKGATIKHIQQETQTYIVTPSREKEPIFEVTGLPDNVQAARKKIEAHIALRTGNLAAPAIDANTAAASNGTGTVHTINSLSQILSEDVSPEFLASIYKNSLCSTFDYADGCINSLNTVSSPPVSANSMGINLNLTACSASHTLINDITSSMSIGNNFQLPSGANISNDFLSSIISRSTVDDLNGHQVFGGGLNLNINNGGNIANGNILSSTATGINHNGNINHNGVVSGIGMSRSCSSASSTTSSKSANNGGGSNSSRPELSNIWKNLSDSLDVDEGIGESPSIWTLPSSLATLSSHYSPAISISPTDSLLGETNSLGQLLATQTQQQQQQRTTVSLNSSSNGIMPQQPHILNHNHHNLGVRRECLICGDKEITAALVPCGHNLFCMECANRICASPEGICPVCSQSVFHAMRILP